MIGNNYWTTGIMLEYYPDPPNWSAYLEFLDDGFCSQESTEGKLGTRYCVDNPFKAVVLLINDAEKLGIEFKFKSLYAKGDGEDPKVNLPEDWRDIWATIAHYAGLESHYDGKVNYEIAKKYETGAWFKNYCMRDDYVQKENQQRYIDLGD